MRLSTSCFCVALWLGGCLGAKDNALFSKTDASTSGGAASNLAGSSAAQSGTGSVNPPGGASGSVSAGGAEATAAADSGGTSNSGTAPGGGSSAASAGMSQAGGASSAGGQPASPSIESCDMLEGSVSNEQNHHCYRLEADELPFAAARDACTARGGHLVTIADAAENDFVLQVHGDDHWLGANDGRDDRTAGVGDYAWVSGEPWSYEHWEGGQPNAHAIDCPDESGGAHCHEHCAYQNGAGNWLDRACWNTIAVVCEWDLEPAGEVPGQGGSP